MLFFILIFRFLISVHCTKKIILKKAKFGETPDKICYNNGLYDLRATLKSLPVLQKMMKKGNIPYAFVSGWYYDSTYHIVHVNGSVTPFIAEYEDTAHAFCFDYVETPLQRKINNSYNSNEKISTQFGEYTNVSKQEDLHADSPGIKNIEEKLKVTETEDKSEIETIEKTEQPQLSAWEKFCIIVNDILSIDPGYRKSLGEKVKTNLTTNNTSLLKNKNKTSTNQKNKENASLNNIKTTNDESKLNSKRDIKEANEITDDSIEKVKNAGNVLVNDSKTTKNKDMIGDCNIFSKSNNINEQKIETEEKSNISKIDTKDEEIDNRWFLRRWLNI